MKFDRLKTIPAVIMTITLGGCFTGVEYTPKVTHNDVRKERIVTTPEDTFLADVADEALREWKPGKRFRITDHKIRLIFGATASVRDSLGGRTLIFDEAREAPSITGTSVTDIVFTIDSCRSLIYRINRPLSTLMEQKALSIPFTIQESLVDDARKLIDGKRLYILTRTWRDDSDNSMNGRQFVAVTVDSVTPGNDIYPIKVSFTDDQGKSARIFLHPGSRTHTPRSFPALFSFTNPRLKYPTINDKAWENIINGRVALDMTREECRLALGAPREVDRGADNSFVREVWLYENGIYLVFEDGLLKMFRH